MFLPSRQSGKTRLPSGVVWVAIYPIHPRRKSMSCHPRVTEWTQTIQAHLPHLSKPQATVLALWSLGMVLARSCALTAVSAFLATWLGRKEPAVRQQLREFCYEAAAKRGTDRCALPVEPCFVPLLAWVVNQWEGTQLALALDATTLGTRFTVLALSVVYRGCAIPVAWTILPATAKHAWRREWLRINTGGTFRPQGHVRGVSLKTLVPEPGTTWQGTGIAFKGRNRQLHCTLLACWEAGDKDPWLILTDLPPEASTACWYGLRAWIEQGFKITKRAGWQWHRTHMTKPERAARLWLAVAVATLLLLSVGGEAEETIPASTVPDVTALVPTPPRMRRATRLRLMSVFRRGWNLILVALLEQAPLPMGRFVPEPWPAVMALEEQALLLPNLEVPLAA